MLKTLVRWKVYLQRALSYMAVLNAGMLFFLTADLLKKYGFQFSILIVTPLLFICSLLFCFLLGWFDLKSGVYEEELRWGSNNNPVLVEILERVKKIEEFKK